MKKILIAFLMSIISLGSITTPTLADDGALSTAMERLVQNQKARCENHKLYKLESVVGTGKTEQDAIDNWSQQAREYMKQYCLSNTPNAGTFDKKCGTGSGEGYGQMTGYVCNKENTCEDEKTQRNIDGRTICQIEQSNNYTDKYVTGNYVSKHKKLVVRYDNSVEYFAVLEGSKYTPSSKDKFPGKNQQSGASVVTKSVASPTQPSASITGNVFDEDGEPATAYVYLQKGGEDLIGSNGSKVVSSTRFDNGAFEFSGYTWGQGYSLRINVMGQDMIINYSDHPDLNTPITFKVAGQGNKLDEVVVDTGIKLNNSCRIINSDGTKTAGSIQYAYPNDESKTNSFACKPNSCEHKTYKATKLTTGTYEYDITQTSFITGQPETWTEQEKGGHIFECELDKSLDPRGNECKDIKTFDPHATDGTIVEWDEKTGEVKQCTSTECEKGFGIINTSSTYIDKNGLSQKIQLCEQTTCPKELIKGYNEPHAKEWAVDEKENHLAKTCRVIECDSDNGWDPSQLTPTKCVRTNQCPCGTHWAWPDEHPQRQEGCISNDGDADCTKEKIGAETAHYGCDSKGKTTCIIDSCLDGWKLNKNNSKPEKNICINQLDCLQWGKAQDAAQKTNKYENATVASWDDDKHTTCIIKACDNMYRVDKSSNTCVIKNDEDIGKLTEARDKARENEKSLENRITGAVGIGGVGIGGMMIGGALSERAADDYAESDMAAYINTFMCDYGDGNTVRGGQTNVEIPGGNELIDLYARYATLANDLKLRKTSLGIKPGIESEIIIDKATSGLYDDVGTGVVGGGYASIARAIMNPTGADAQMWAAQRAATTSKLNTGIGIATTAAALTLAQSLRDAFNKPVEQLQKEIQEIPAESCSKYTGTTGHGDINTPCQCANTDERFFRDQGGCVPCPAGLEYNKYNDCACKKGTFEDEENPGTCITINTPVKCPLSGANIFFNDADGTCRCNDDAIQESDNTCTKCSYGIADDGQTCKPEPEKPKPGTEIINMNLDADALFKSGKFDLQEQASIKVSDFATKAYMAALERNVDLSNSSNYCLIIIGHTDRQKYANDPTNAKNYKLSEDRANAVKDVLKQYFVESAIWTKGVADRDCIEPHKSDDKECRKVEMIVLAGACVEGIDYSEPENRAKASLIRETTTTQ